MKQAPPPHHLLPFAAAYLGEEGAVVEGAEEAQFYKDQALIVEQAEK